MGSVDRDNALAAQLIQAGNRLLAPSSSVDSLLSLLDQVETLLSNVEQEPATLMRDALYPSMKALISTDILNHQNMNVRVSVASCITEITRITAPDAPYNDNLMKEVFELTVEALERLADASDPCYKKAELIIDTVSKVRSCLLMLDLECNELILEMIHRFFEITSCNSNHPPGVISAMETIMTMVIDESENISPSLLDALLANVTKEIGSISPVSLKLGEKVLASCGHKLKPYIVEALTSTGNSLAIYSPVVATILQNISSIEDRKSACPEKKEKDEKISTGICSSEPLEGTVEQATSGNTKVMVKDVTLSTGKSKNMKKGNSLNTTKGCSTRGQFKSKDAEAETETFPKKSRLKPNIPSSKKRSKRTTGSGPAKTPITKDPLSTNAASCSTKLGQTVLSPLMLEGGSRGPRKRGRVEIVEKGSDQVDSLPLSTLKKGESNVNIKDKDPLLIDVAIKVEPEEENGLYPEQKCTKESIDATVNKKSVKKIKTGCSLEEVVVEVPVIEGKIKGSGGKRSLVSDGKRKKTEDATPVKVVTEASRHKKLKSPETTNKPSRKRIEETPKDNPKQKQSDGKEMDSKLPGPGDELVGRRIKVWWPLDKTFYEGIVNLYDNIKKKHQVLYADGDTELLNLRRQRWELIQDDAFAKEEEEEQDQERLITISEIMQKHKEKTRKESKNHRKAGSSAKSSSTMDIATGTDKNDGDQGMPEASTRKSGMKTEESQESKPKECNLMKSQKESESRTRKSDRKPQKPKNGTNPLQNEAAMTMPESKEGIVSERSRMQKPKNGQKTKRTEKGKNSRQKKASVTNLEGEEGVD